MSEKIIKWGFIGCGEVTKTKSGPAFQKVEHSEVVAVMSRDGAKAKAYAKERGIKRWYDDVILHGRYVCVARAPKCDECGIATWCRKYASDHRQPKTLKI